MININKAKNNEFYGAVRRVNYETLIALATIEGVEDNFTYLNPNLGSILKETEKRKGEVVQMYLNVSFSGTSLVGLPSYGPCEFDIPLCGGDFSDWTSGAGTFGQSSICATHNDSYITTYDQWNGGSLDGTIHWEVTIDGTDYDGDEVVNGSKSMEVDMVLAAIVAETGLVSVIRTGETIMATGTTAPCQDVSGLLVTYTAS